VLNPYAFGLAPPEGSQDVDMTFDIPAAPGSLKRRRTDEASSALVNDSNLGWETQGEQQHAGPGIFDNGTHTTGRHQYTATVGTHGSGEHAASSLNEHAGASNPYPDVSSYSQPYFYQQTHPSTYTSPWPPNENASFGQQSNSYPQPSSMTGAATDMPFFPSHTQAEATDAIFRVEDVQQQQLLPGLAQDNFNTPPFAYASRNENGVARSDVPAEASAFLYEDASRHLKIQSLPILENLVCSNIICPRYTFT
jgi:hypothetical protein